MKRNRLLGAAPLSAMAVCAAGALLRPSIAGQAIDSKGAQFAAGLDVEAAANRLYLAEPPAVGLVDTGTSCAGEGRYGAGFADCAGSDAPDPPVGLRPLDFAFAAADSSAAPMIPAGLEIAPMQSPYWGYWTPAAATSVKFAGDWAATDDSDQADRFAVGGGDAFVKLAVPVLAAFALSIMSGLVMGYLRRRRRAALARRIKSSARRNRGRAHS